jgi:hypothetical protein
MDRLNYLIHFYSIWERLDANNRWLKQGSIDPATKSEGDR